MVVQVSVCHGCGLLWHLWYDSEDNSFVINFDINILEQNLLLFCCSPFHVLCGAQSYWQSSIFCYAIMKIIFNLFYFCILVAQFQNYFRPVYLFFISLVLAWELIQTFLWFHVIWNGIVYKQWVYYSMSTTFIYLWSTILLRYRSEIGLEANEQVFEVLRKIGKYWKHCAIKILNCSVDYVIKSFFALLFIFFYWKVDKHPECQTDALCLTLHDVSVSACSFFFRVYFR